MTQEEQQQVNAAMEHMRRLLGIAATEGANAASLAESLAIQLKAAREELDALKAVPPDGKPVGEHLEVVR